jgi:hypothetical protein
MLRWLAPIVVSTIWTGCGDNGQPLSPDAAPDSPVGTDSAVCAADVQTDEANCGQCDHLCKGGEVCKSAACNCPSGIVPPLVFPTGFEQFFDASIVTITLAPTLSLSGVNGLVFGHNANIVLDTDIDLATVLLGTPPFVGALAGLDIDNLAVDASYAATAGTLRFTKRCATEIEGTLTDATFKGIKGGLLGGGIPMIDPDGCEIHVSSLSFHLATTPCP